ncbi:MAG: UDP-N-acetylmuramate--L-alanine ligase [Bacteroidetes bacterium CG23_combo_of_CG06-09_8_20_14_all_32_9]|nr:MAG: UDP-N-acetylmuramate--L-alanine ligase [Bacteroidetes bacterium CG23_combo_of_CG06-09_8_20_14_all_32_9]
MNFNNLHSVYLIGIGGIGMSALAKYFKLHGCMVEGYDRTQTPLCNELVQSGIPVHYAEDILLVSATFKDISKKENVLIIYTPAVPQNNKELEWFRNNGFNIKKRATVLGDITEEYSTIAVAGTHGKTTTSTCIAHIFTQSGLCCNAFLGGISKNYNTNFLYTNNCKTAVVEADEYDHSFLHLTPADAIITAVDADHLDIYGSLEKVTEAFCEFAKHIKHNGKLLIKKETAFVPPSVYAEIATYSVKSNADCTISNLLLSNSKFTFNLKTPWGNIDNISPGITGMFNIENIVAAASLCLWKGLSSENIKTALSSFKGVKRRFDVQFSNSNYIYIDDYAHHPEELKAFISSVKEIYPQKYITGIFQPHLYSRTRDFADGFGSSLSLLNELYLLDIYPAREEPIPGISGNTILNKVKIENKMLCSKEELLKIIETKKPELLLTMGAGDIDQLVEPIKNIYSK